MRNKMPIRIMVGFAVLMFIIVTFAVLLVGGISALLYALNVFNRPHPLLLISIVGLTCILISTIFAGLAGKRELSPFIRITEATKEIAKGNYSVRLDEDIRFIEIRDTAKNFNLMAQELSNTETFRNDFIANVSHEFKTPITAIEGYVTLLQNHDLSEGERDEYIGRILKSTRRLSTLAGNILQISRLENQDIRPPSKEYSLDEQLRQVVLLAEPQWTAKGLNLDIDLESVSYRGNQNMLAQVWQNIFENAVKFAPQGGSIRVILRNEEMAVKVSISDNGPGMTEEVLGRAFEKFYQGDESHASAGSGLGLTLAKRIVDLHGGTIQVTSKQKKGSTFTVTLPHMG